jgi:deazaflavin-dependent oxidoreductase (nitroreductase family)
MSDFDMNEFNQGIIEEFRANAGVVSNPMLEWTPQIQVPHRGAKTGTQRVTPLAYQALDGGRWAIFASMAGAPNNPAWYHNLVADSDTTIEVGSGTIEVTATVADPATREAIWQRQKEQVPQFAEYAAATDRTIPVVVLTPRD